MKFTGATLLISAAYLASIVSAQIISITSPLTGTKYEAGKDAIISWVNPKVSTISQIVLARGPSTALQPIQTIATNVNANDLKYVWKIPNDIESGKDYAFEIGTSPDLAFTGPFEIVGSTGGSSSASNSTTSSGSSTPPAAGAPVSPANGNGGSSSSPTTTTNTNSQAAPHNANASHASAANKQVAGQAVVALGLAAVAASQFF